MPWLPAADEIDLKRLIDYDLPLATSQLAVASRWRRLVYHGLRTRARRRLRSGGPSGRFDPWLFDRLVADRLDRTFIP
jgi:hypothetical protein